MWQRLWQPSAAQLGFAWAGKIINGDNNSWDCREWQTNFTMRKVIWIQWRWWLSMWRAIIIWLRDCLRLEPSPIVTIREIWDQPSQRPIKASLSPIAQANFNFTEYFSSCGFSLELESKSNLKSVLTWRRVFVLDYLQQNILFCIKCTTRITAECSSIRAGL